MEPILSVQAKAAHLRYELPHRVHDAAIYPVRAPNGSTIVLYGHDAGVTIVWRGGRPLKQLAPQPAQRPPPPRVNGTAVVNLESDSDSGGEPTEAARPPPPTAEFEDEEEELDPDQPYPSIVQHLHLSLNAHVLHVAVPPLPATAAMEPTRLIPPVFGTKMLFTVACSDYSVRVISMLLNPPPDAAKEKAFSSTSQYGEEVLKVPTHAGHQIIPRGVSMTWTSRSEPSARESREDEMAVDGEEGVSATPGRRRAHRRQSQSNAASQDGKDEYDLLVASHSTELGGLLKLWRFSLGASSIAMAGHMAAYKTVTLGRPASQVAFSTAQYPKRRHAQLLIAETSGLARVYDPFASSGRRLRATNAPAFGAFVASFRATFEHTKTNPACAPRLSARKPILDAAWASEGRHIVALLADGEWGVWDVDRSGPTRPGDPSAFALRGFVGTAEREGASGGASSPKRSSRNSLAPMTPNTRKRNEETLFQGTASNHSTRVRGGVSVASLSSADGASFEDSVIIWYGAELYRIPHLSKFWSRVATSNNGNSLPGPGPSQLHGVPLLGEAITSISQFDTTAQEARKAIPRDILISAEHRLIITTGTKEPLGRDLNPVLASEQVEDEEGRKTDQALLARGELGLGGMDRLLESMDESQNLNQGLAFGNPNPRKVLFAADAS